MVLWEPVKIVFIQKKFDLVGEWVTFSCYFTHLVVHLQCLIFADVTWQSDSDKYTHCHFNVLMILWITFINL